MTPTEVRDLLGDSVRVPPESAVNEICSILDRALAAVRDVEARFGDEVPLDGWLRGGSPSTAELLRRLREWASAHGYYERTTASAVCWGPTPRRSVVFLYPADVSVTLDLDYAQRHGKRTEAKRLLDVIRTEWGVPQAAYRWQPLAGADVLARWPDFTDLVLDPLAQIDAAELGVAELEG
jgi:hypothetical protein